MEKAEAEKKGIRLVIQESLKLTKSLSKLQSCRTPILVQYGEMDRICKPMATYNFFEDIASEDKTLKEYSGAFHNLLMELPDTRRETFEDMNKWIVERI